MLVEGVSDITEIRTSAFLKDHSTVYFIYDRYVLICTLGDNVFAMRIESPVFHQSQLQLFEFLWNSSNPVNG